MKSKKNLILINKTPSLTRLARLKNNILSDFHIEPTRSPSQVGAIYKARVVEKQLGLDACFVNIGEEKTAFLWTGKKYFNPPASPQKANNSSVISTELSVKKGQNLLVQVIKNPLKSKNFRVSHRISLPGVYLVYLPNSPTHIGVSRQIEDEKTREKLSQWMEKLKPSGGVIVRTRAVTAKEKDLQADLEYLKNMWDQIQKKYQSQRRTGLTWPADSSLFSFLKDFLTEEVDEVWIDEAKMFSFLKEKAKKALPKEQAKISLYKGRSLFTKYNLESQINQLLNKEVKLKSGGFIVLEETEAAVVVDVNTGSFRGKHPPEKNILKINLEAAYEIVRQIRLRNCGGIVLIDFIDMEQESSRAQVMECLSQELKKDRRPTRLFNMSEIGVVQLTRKRSSGSLLEMLCQPCPRCKGRGFEKKSK